MAQRLIPCPEVREHERHVDCLYTGVDAAVVEGMWSRAAVLYSMRAIALDGNGRIRREQAISARGAVRRVLSDGVDERHFHLSVYVQLTASAVYE